MIFKSSRNIYIVITLWAVIVLLSLPFLVFIQSIPWQIILGAGSAIVICDALLLWILFDTKYIIRNHYFNYYSGPYRGNINIKSIRKIETDNSFIKSTLLKPALGTNGLVIYYNKFDDIFISPADKNGFIKQILIINPDIELKQ